MANKALPLLIAGGAALLFLPKKKKKTTRGPIPSSPEDVAPRIEFDAECGWQIPTEWWAGVGGPKLKSILDEGLAGAATWDEKFALLKTPAFNSHKITYDLLSGETNPVCPLPPADVDVNNLPPTITKQEENMIFLFGHMINHVEDSMTHFVNTKGEEFVFTTP